MSFAQVKRMMLGWATLAALACSGLSQQSRHGGAETVSVAALRVPVKARQHFDKARLAAFSGRYAECDRELAAALALDPEFGEAYVLRASIEVMTLRFDQAIADVLTAQRLEPGIPGAAIVHAEACNGQKRFDEAFALLDSLKSTEIGTWQAKYEMTRAVVGRGDAVAALQWSKLALEAVPSSALPNTLLLRANAFQLARRWPEAVELLDKYLALPGTQPTRSRVAAVRDRIARLTGTANNTMIAAH